MAPHTRPPISPDDFVLSVVIPIYNERDTVEEILRQVRDAPFRKEIVVVDDGSADGTREVLRELEAKGKIDRLILHEKNQGKGAALRTGFAHVTGDLVVVQDADLEYDPSEYRQLLQPFFDGKADVVFGSRFISGRTHRVLFFWHSIANRCLTLISNMFTNLNLTDMETCYKVFRREVIQAVEINENRFGFEPEITAKVAHMQCRIYEVGISYDGRGYQDGKKIGWKDAIWAFVCVLRYGLFYRPQNTVETLLARADAKSASGSEAKEKADAESRTASARTEGGERTEAEKQSAASAAAAEAAEAKGSERSGNASTPERETAPETAREREEEKVPELA